MTVSAPAWQPIEACPEDTWVPLQAEWDRPPVHICKFKWATNSEWETVNESRGASGARRQTRQEKLIRHRVWDNGIGEHAIGEHAIGEHAVGDYRYWMPLPDVHGECQPKNEEKP